MDEHLLGSIPALFEASERALGSECKTKRINARMALKNIATNDLLARKFR